MVRERRIVTEKEIERKKKAARKIAGSFVPERLSPVVQEVRDLVTNVSSDDILDRLQKISDLLEDASGQDVLDSQGYIRTLFQLGLMSGYSLEELNERIENEEG